VPYRSYGARLLLLRVTAATRSLRNDGMPEEGPPAEPPEASRPLVVSFVCPLVRRRGHLGLLRQQAVAVDDCRRHVDQLPIRRARVLSGQFESHRLVNRVAFHQDALRTFGYGAATEGAFEIVRARSSPRGRRGRRRGVPAPSLLRRPQPRSRARSPPTRARRRSARRAPGDPRARSRSARADARSHDDSFCAHRRVYRRANLQIRRPTPPACGC
jgi:hypothetical protein